MKMSRASLAEFKPQPKNDSYTVLLGISLMAMLAACGLLFYDLQRYPTTTPEQSAKPMIQAGPAGGAPAGGGGVNFDPNR
jgi:hypothetical protein